MQFGSGSVKTNDFDYNLPEELIAQTPLERRDSSKLLVMDKVSGGINHEIFSNITSYLKKGDVLVLNDTKVIPARLFGHRVGKEEKIEILLLEISIFFLSILLNSYSLQPSLTIAIFFVYILLLELQTYSVLVAFIR